MRPEAPQILGLLPHYNGANGTSEPAGKELYNIGSLLALQRPSGGMGNYTTNLFKTPEARRLPADKGFVYYNRDSDDQSFSASCHHTPSTGSEATLGDEWFNYEMLEYYVPAPRKAKVNRAAGTKRARTRAKQIHVVPLLTNLVGPGPTMHVVIKENIAIRSSSAPAVLVSSPSAETASDKTTILVTSVARSNLVNSKLPLRAVPTEQSSFGELDIFPSTSNVDNASKETPPDTSSIVSRNVTLDSLVRFQNTSARISSSAPAAILSEPSVETFFEMAESAAVVSDVTTSNLTVKIQSENIAESSRYAVEILSEKTTSPESGVDNEGLLTQIKSKRVEVTEGCLGRTATQFIAALKSCIGIGSNDFMAYSVSYILKGPTSHENLIQQM
ncbi:uncharacterized protein [Heptranchias perlo]|uniref:uncharacterized protein n=1 Tax=Heptranchias perlo TaxID=212740 RepID=UPI00355A3080